MAYNENFIITREKHWHYPYINVMYKEETSYKTKQFIPALPSQ
jgi:hypothetical protein